MIIENHSLRNKFFVFRNREHAGEELARFLEEKLEVKEDLVVLAVPRGGIPVGCVIAKRLKAPLGLVIVRKIPIPWDTEAGFGALSPDGDVFIDERLKFALNIDDETIKVLVKEVLQEIKRREKVFSQVVGKVKIEEKNIILVDDGIAAGFTMFAAVNYVKKRNPKRIYIAVPTGCIDALKRLEPLVDAIFCLNIRSPIPYFAVADAYKEWRDLTDEDVLFYLRKYGYIT